MLTSTDPSARWPPVVHQVITEVAQALTGVKPTLTDWKHWPASACRRVVWSADYAAVVDQDHTQSPQWKLSLAPSAFGGRC